MPSPSRYVTCISSLPPRWVAEAMHVTIESETAPQRAHDTGVRERSFGEIVDLSRSMLESAEKGDWAAVTETQMTRQALIDEFFSVAPAADEARWLAAGIRNILESDRQLMDLGKRTMDALSTDLCTFEVGRRAQAAYAGR